MHSHRLPLAAALAILVAVVGMTTLPLLALGGGPGLIPDPLPPLVVAGIPPRVLAAYRAADGWCEGLRWQLLAGIGHIESGHASFGGAAIDPNTGEVTPWILGVPLDGSGDTQRLPVGRWVGAWGQEGPWLRALGPMQFLAATFDAWGVDGDGDGARSPHDLDDAAASAANYLCAGPDGRVGDERAALRRYNVDGVYAEQVLAYADSLTAAVKVSGDGWLCPVAGPVAFTDTWGAPRSGGRRHRGVDMFATRGTPVVASVAGVVERSNDGLGGLSYQLWGDDGTYYFGTHLSAYGRASGRITAGTIVGYVGDTGNARGTGAHLHFEIHPDRARGEPSAAVNPTVHVTSACATSRLGTSSSAGS